MKNLRDADRGRWLVSAALMLCALLIAPDALAAKGGNGIGRGWFGSNCQSGPATPTIDGLPTFSLMEGSSYQFTPSAADANCDKLSFSISGKPAWASFNRNNGTLSGTPPAGSAGDYPNVLISVSDGTYTAALPPFTITVYANTPPTIGGTPPGVVTSGKAYAFTPITFDPDGQTLRFSAANVPGWATFDGTSGRLSGTPGDANIGTYGNIVISVSDGVVSASLAPFSITVKPNTPPTISGTPPGAVTTGQAYSFTPAASDADGDALTFAIANKPGWASFNASTGQISGTPAASAAGEYIGITISVSDGKATTSLPAFSIVVSAANSPPTIAGTPPGAVVAGQAYQFVPSASDADGDALSFSIANKPAWASFSAATGALAGTPAAADVGTYANVQISVSDGKATTSLPAFAIAVQSSANGSATLSWQPPTTNTDGSPLTDLAGYRIRYGNAPGSYTSTVTLANPGLTSYVVSNLGQGAWYFVMTSYTTSGVESDFSTVASKTIQ